MGSVGTRAWILLLEAGAGSSPVPAGQRPQTSVLADYAGESEFANQGERVVAGQRLMQASSDIFLGWFGPGADRRSGPRLLLRQCGTGSSAVIEEMTPRGCACMPGSVAGRSPGPTLVPATDRYRGVPGRVDIRQRHRRLRGDIRRPERTRPRRPGRRPWPMDESRPSLGSNTMPHGLATARDIAMLGELAKPAWPIRSKTTATASSHALLLIAFSSLDQESDATTISRR